MTRLFAVVSVCIALVGCSKHGGSANPSSPTQDLPKTPSSQANVMSISVVKDGVDKSNNALMDVAIGENYNMGLVGNSGINDWNGATISLVRNCDGKESQELSQYPNSADPTTGKNRVLFKQIATCNGLVNIRLRFTAYGSSTLVNFTFPNAGTQLVLAPAGLLHLVNDGPTGLVYVRSNNPL